MSFPFKEVTTEQVLRDAFGQSKGYVKVMDGKSQKFYPSEELISHWDRIREDHSPFNLFVSIGQFVTPKKGGKVDNLAALCMMPVDIDYDIPGMCPEECYEMIVDKLTKNGLSVIPFPTYVECGHRLRILYLFQTPYIVRYAGRKRRSCFRFLSKLFQYYVNVVNSIDPRLHAETQKLSSFFRPAGSLNFKGVWDVQNHCYKEKETHKVRIYEGGGHPMDVNALASFVLKSRSEWESTRTKKKIRMKAKIHVKAKGKSFLLRRLDFLLDLQAKLHYDCIGMRETMCWNFYNVLLSLGNTPGESFRQMRRFNSNFRSPLSTAEIRGARTTKIYRIRDWKFYAQFGEEQPAMTREEKRAHDRAYSKERRAIVRKIREDAGDMAWQKREARRQKVSELRANGYGANDIARVVGVSRRTVYYDLALSES